MDVVIIGGGAAGLAAAHVLSKAGVAVELLEAQERLGGRILSLPAPDGSPLELGAEFVHGNSPVIAAITREAGLSIVPVTMSHWELRNGKPVPVERAFDQISQLIRQAQGHGEETSVGLFLSRFDGDHPLHAAAEWARLLVEGFDAADPARASLAAIVEEWTGGAGVQRSQGRVQGGYGRLIAHLASVAESNGTRIRLGTVVSGVRWKTNEIVVEARARGESYQVTARCAIVTVPVAILKAPPHQVGAIAFTPALTGKSDALDHLIMGDVVKVLLRFRDPFWERIGDGRLGAAAFFHARDQVFPTFWTALPDRSPVLTAWTGGPHAERLADADEATITSTAMAGVAALFGRHVDPAAQLVEARVHNWHRDPFTLGAYSYVAVGGRKAHGSLAASLDNTLFLAGEATDDSGESGTVTGALASGERAAEQVLAAFKV